MNQSAVQKPSEQQTPVHQNSMQETNQPRTMAEEQKQEAPRASLASGSYTPSTGYDRYKAPTPMTDHSQMSKPAYQKPTEGSHSRSPVLDVVDLALKQATLPESTETVEPRPPAYTGTKPSIVCLERFNYRFSESKQDPYRQEAEQRYQESQPEAQKSINPEPTQQVTVKLLSNTI